MLAYSIIGKHFYPCHGAIIDALFGYDKLAYDIVCYYSIVCFRCHDNSTFSSHTIITIVQSGRFGLSPWSERLTRNRKQLSKKLFKVCAKHVSLF